MSKHRTRTTRWNRLLSGVLCLALALGLLPSAGMVRTVWAADAGESAHWASPYAEQLVEWGVMSDAPDLRLNDVATRAEFVAMCNRAFGYSKLGGTPFTDVPSSAWYAQDIDIAYNAGYFKGVSDSSAYPAGTLTREQAAVLLARIMRLQETVGESLGFTDSRELSDWSSGLVAAAVTEGIITGYGDGSYRPFNDITRGELAVMLVRAIGTPVSAAGSHEMGDVYGNVTISSSDVTLRDTVILGNLYITGGVELGNVLLENVTVLGRIIISGGGVSDAAKSSVILRNVTADELVVDSMVDQFVTISAYGLTDIGNTYVRSDSYLEDECAAGYGLHHIELVGEFGTELQLAGKIKEVVNKTPGSSLKLVKGTAETITIDELATNSQLLIDINTRVDVLNLDVATLVTGRGDIGKLNIWADGCEVDILPEEVEIRPGLTATVNGEEIGSLEASELSSEPRLMAGYPKVDDLTLDQTLGLFQANGLFSGNKPGTIYWAVSEIADGSVGMDDLIKNPTYGGNIYGDNSGNFGADSKLVYVQQITDLVPDNSYYISAVLVDERNNRSPLKVASFNIPDNTQPAFVDEPYMSRITCDTAQVTAMVNKSCTLYWVLLPHGAVPPTVQDFKSGSFGGGYYGYGSQSVVKNVPISITVNSGRLREKTDFDLYLWLNDFDGTMHSEVYHVLNKDTKRDSDPTFTTPDETAPVVTNIMQNDFGQEDAIGFIFAINEAPSTLYWAVVAETDTTFIKADDDMKNLRVQMRVESGTGAIVSGHKDADGAYVDTQVTPGTGVNNFNRLLDAAQYGHNFKMYYVAKDAAGNYSEVRYIVIHTKDAENPTVTLSFPEDKMSGGKPQADTDIILTFSEQVKGDSDLDADTFVDLYNEVKIYQDLINAGDTSPANVAMLNSAKAALAEELGKHITLYYVEIVGGRRNSIPMDATEKDYGWINWGEAIVELQKSGKVVLTLPAGKAVSLSGGMEYYFYFQNIYDDSYNANLLDVVDEDGRVISSSTNNNGSCETAHFTTMYAMVWLSENLDGISKIEGGDFDGTELDMVVDVTPSSTKSTKATDCWDMVIWSELAVQFDVYRRVDGGDWELAAEGVTIYGASSSSSGGSSDQTAASLNNDKTETYINGTDFAGTEGAYEHNKYDTMVGGLQEGHVYQYGISFTSVGSDAGASDRTSWTSLVQLRFSLVAGTLGNVQNLSDSGNVNSSYTDLVYTRALLDEIGTVGLGNTTGTILEVEKQFRDERTPEFTSTEPTLSAGTGTIDLTVALNRNGTVYYVVAPAGAIPTFIESGVEITSANDGSLFDDGELKEGDENITKLEWLAKYANGNSYIPLSGAERTSTASEDGEKALSDYIHFATMDNDGKYYAPTFIQIYNGGFSGEQIRTGSIVYEGVRRSIPIAEGLEPGKWYYVYLVLQSTSGALDEVVQIYRVKTKDVEPPVITISHYDEVVTDSATETSSTHVGVTMTITERDSNTNYDSPVLNYALLRRDNLPELLKGEFRDRAVEDFEVPSGYSDGMTVLDAMLNRSGRQTYFDLYASDDLKTEVMQYITQATGADKWGVWIKYYDQVGMDKLTETNPWPQDCTDQLTTAGEYILLACARNYYKDDAIGTNFGFAAVQGIYKPDDVPPEFTGITNTNVSAYITGVYREYGKASPVPNWGSSPNQSLLGYYFSGTITLTFSKSIYVYRDNVLKQVVSLRPTQIAAAGNEDTQVSILDVIDAQAGIFSVDQNDTSGTTFTLNFDNLRNGQLLIMQNLYNSSGSEDGQSPKRLTVKFQAGTMSDEVVNPDYPNESEDQFVRFAEPSFYITWQVES